MSGSPDGLLPEEEKRAFGFLGEPPPEILAAPAQFTLQWRKLAQKAARVAEAPFSKTKVRRAQEIEMLRAALIREAEKHTK